MCYKLKSVHFKSHVTPPCLSVRFMLHALLSGLIKHHVQALFYPLKTVSCFGATLPLPSSPPFPLPLPLPSSFSDSSPKACRDMKPLVFKRDNNNSKVILIIDSHLEHRPTFKCLYCLLIHAQDDLWLLNLTLSNNSLWKMWSWCVICSQFVEKDWRQTFSMRNLYVTWLKSVGE